MQRQQATVSQITNLQAFSILELNLASLPVLVSILLAITLGHFGAQRRAFPETKPAGHSDPNVNIYTCNRRVNGRNRAWYLSA